MLTRSPRTILALSAALALTAASLGSTAAMAKGPNGNGRGSDPAACAGDCSAEQPQAQERIRARDGSGSAAGPDTVQARGYGRNAKSDSVGNAKGSGWSARAGVDARQGRNARNGAGQGPNEDGERGPGTWGDCDAEMGTLTDEQVAGLVFMANEEKLAHDVYAAFAEQHGVRIFENIAAAEARHQQAVRAVLQRYGLEDSAIDLPAGEFSDPAIAMLYATLMEQGAATLDEAIAVGVLIEETDIADLESRMAVLEETAPDVHQMYSHLLAASQNHLAAFQGWS